ncbi:MAG: hypothetical protein DMF55_11270 [Acidobacteria bacterium]|nr:MAG: hypothetical protein DMF55_11270 [Acidobacteriota bacterium]
MDRNPAARPRQRRRRVRQRDRVRPRRLRAVVSGAVLLGLAPLPRARRGAGFTVPIARDDPWSFVVGYRIVHISNAGTYYRNPSWNFHGVVLGFRRFVGGDSSTR